MRLQQADEHLEAALDNKTYNEADLFLVKIPINLPYQTNWSGYERVDGEVTVAGETYKYVQRKVEKDTMYLQCIRHTERNTIAQKANDYLSKTTDVANHNNSKKTNNTAAKFAAEEFVNHIIEWQILAIANGKTYNATVHNITTNTHLQQLIRPPQA
ncbi:hypothetical protein ACFOW1_08045 [Parasediminibacterium paludis]|uniref:Uncharacterized protein n=1 Tax=Parasediminibacterium paludis TaxID=908966 RepID=A0ABV8PUS4_9BACT